MSEIVAEEWRPVVGYEGLYEVSSLGRVRSLARKDRMGRPVPKRILRLVQSTGGYFRVSLCRDGSQASTPIHRLVCETFHGPAPAGKPFALHGNHDPSDNRPENLRWGSQAENMQDKVDADRQLKGEAHGRAKVTEADVKAIQDDLLAGATYKAVAAKYGLARSYVGQIARGETWVHLAKAEVRARCRGVLNDSKVFQVFDLAAQGLLQVKIAASLSVGEATISRILRASTPRYRALRARWIEVQAARAGRPT